jgi:hypothetical protein
MTLLRINGDDFFEASRQEEKMIHYRLHCNYSSASRRGKPSFQWRTLLSNHSFWKIAKAKEIPWL